LVEANEALVDPMDMLKLLVGQKIEGCPLEYG